MSRDDGDFVPSRATVKQLVDYAARRGIDLGGARRKADIIAVVEAAMPSASASTTSASPATALPSNLAGLVAGVPPSVLEQARSAGVISREIRDSVDRVIMEGMRGHEFGSAAMAGSLGAVMDYSKNTQQRVGALKEWYFANATDANKSSLRAVFDYLFHAVTTPIKDEVGRLSGVVGDSTVPSVRLAIQRLLYRKGVEFQRTGRQLLTRCTWVNLPTGAHEPETEYVASGGRDALRVIHFPDPRADSDKYACYDIEDLHAYVVRHLVARFGVAATAAAAATTTTAPATASVTSTTAAATTAAKDAGTSRGWAAWLGLAGGRARARARTARRKPSSPIVSPSPSPTVSAALLKSPAAASPSASATATTTAAASTAAALDDDLVDFVSKHRVDGVVPHPLAGTLDGDGRAVYPRAFTHADVVRIARWYKSYRTLHALIDGGEITVQDVAAIEALSDQLMPRAVVEADMGLLGRVGRGVYNTALALDFGWLYAGEWMTSWVHRIVMVHGLLSLLRGLICILIRVVIFYTQLDKMSAPRAAAYLTEILTQRRVQGTRSPKHPFGLTYLEQYKSSAEWRELGERLNFINVNGPNVAFTREGMERMVDALQTSTLDTWVQGNRRTVFEFIAGTALWSWYGELVAWGVGFFANVVSGNSTTVGAALGAISTALESTGISLFQAVGGAVRGLGMTVNGGVMVAPWTTLSTGGVAAAGALGAWFGLPWPLVFGLTSAFSTATAWGLRADETAWIHTFFGLVNAQWPQLVGPKKGGGLTWGEGLLMGDAASLSALATILAPSALCYFSPKRYERSCREFGERVATVLGTTQVLVNVAGALVELWALYWVWTHRTALRNAPDATLRELTKQLGFFTKTRCVASLEGQLGTLLAKDVGRIDDTYDRCMRLVSGEYDSHADKVHPEEVAACKRLLTPVIHMLNTVGTETMVNSLADPQRTRRHAELADYMDHVGDPAASIRNPANLPAWLVGRHFAKK